MTKVCGPLLLLAVLCLLLFVPFIFQGKVLFWADHFLQFFPYHCLFRESAIVGRIPLWNPYVYGGMPFLGCLQSAIFYPVNWALLAVPVHDAMTVHVLLHVFLFGAFTNLLLRQWNVGSFGSLTGAATMMLSGFTACRMEYPTVLAAGAWLPLLVLLIDRIFHGERRSLFFITPVVAIDILSGHLQISLMCFLFAGAYALVCFRGMRARAMNMERRRCAWMATAGGLAGILLAAPQLLPTWETLLNSTRSEVSFDFAAIYSLPPWQLVTMLFPNSFGNPNRSLYWGDANFWELTAYCGIVGWVFVGATVMGLTRASADTSLSIRARFLIGAALVALVISLGKFTPIYGWLYQWTPGFDSFKGPGRFLFVYVFSFSLLVGIGADQVSRRGLGGLAVLQRFMGRLIVVVGALLGVLVIGRSALLPRIVGFLKWQFPRIHASASEGKWESVAEGVHAVWLQDALTALALLAVLFFVTRLALLGRVPLSRWKVAAFSFVLIDLLVFGCTVNPWTDASLFTGESRVAKFLQSQNGDFRILTRPSLRLHTWGTYVPFTRPVATNETDLAGLRESLAPSLSTVHHVVNIEGYDPLRPEAAQRILDRVNGALDESGDVGPLIEANVRYVLGYQEHFRSSALQKVLDLEGVEVYENMEWTERNDEQLPSIPYMPWSYRVGLFVALITWLLWVCVAVKHAATAKTNRRVDGTLMDYDGTHMSEER